jgi:hypothetical protein
MTGQELRSFQGAFRAHPDKPFVVDAVQNDPRLASDYPRVTPAAELPKLRFRAVRLVRGWFGPTASYGDFTQAGPDAASLKPLPWGITRLVHDPAGKKYYGLADHELHEVDLENRTSKKLGLGPAAWWVSRPYAITFDTKRERLVVAAEPGGFGYLYTYTPRTGAWSFLVDPNNNIDVYELNNNLYPKALAYHPGDDTIYGLVNNWRGDDGDMPTLYRYNALGGIVKKTRLGPPMCPGLFGRSRGGNWTQLVSVDDLLAAVFTIGARPWDDRDKPESFLYLIDPKTDKVRLAWKE